MTKDVYELSPHVTASPDRPGQTEKVQAACLAVIILKSIILISERSEQQSRYSIKLYIQSHSGQTTISGAKIDNINHIILMFHVWKFRV